MVESYGRAYGKDPCLIKENMEALGVNDPDAADEDDRDMAESVVRDNIMGEIMLS